MLKVCMLMNAHTGKLVKKTKLQKCRFSLFGNAEKVDREFVFAYFLNKVNLKGKSKQRLHSDIFSVYRKF